MNFPKPKEWVISVNNEISINTNGGENKILRRGLDLPQINL